MDQTGHERPAPAERFAGREHLIDLGGAARELRSDGSEARHGHRQITLVHEDGVSLILFDFEAGGRLADHSADGLVTIQVIAGQVDVRTAAATHAVTAGTLLVLEPGIVHDLTAMAPSLVLLTVHMRSAATGA